MSLAYLDAIDQVTLKAQAALPDSGERVEKARQIVLKGDVELLPDGYVNVTSQTNGVQRYHIVNGTCECYDASVAPRGFCKHRIAAGIAKRVEQIIAHPDETPCCPVCFVTDCTGCTPVIQQTHGIASEHIVLIKGRPYVTYQGLLLAAHGQGLTKLEARFISVTDGLALAEATATFADGRVFTEAGDATPTNVSAQVRPHFPRMALVRAKARCLRDALGAMCAVEELGDVAEK